jgi:cytidyltransferase-like protein
MQKKVLVFGTFDGLHEGHRDLFGQAAKYGDYVIAVVARDSTVLKNKARQPKFNEQERLKVVQQSGLLQEALLGEENHDTKNSKFELIAKIKPDVICLGYDQAQFAEKLKEELRRMGLENIIVVVLEPYKPEIYKSSLLNKN